MNDIAMPRGWKAVPMPDQIAVLPRDRRGFPIPYVAEWNHSDNVTTMLANDHIMRMDCDCVIGKDAPILGQQCPVRQRECMSQRKCQVCSHPIGMDEVCYFLGGMPVEVFIEPPLHESCAIYSLQVCPGVVRREGMSVHVCADYTLTDRLEFFSEMDPDHPEGIYVPTGQIPLPVLLGLSRAGFAYHGARPNGGHRYDAAEFLQAVAVHG